MGGAQRGVKARVGKGLGKDKEKNQLLVSAGWCEEKAKERA